MIYFYARVSSKDQNLARQLEVAKGYKNVDKIFCDKQSGKDFDRAEYQQMKSVISKGDELIVKSLDRLGRNKEATKGEIKWFKDNGIILRILDVPTTLIDFQGQDWIMDMVNNIMIEVLSSYAEQERETIKKRQAEGIAAKRASGTWDEYGRPKKITDCFDALYEDYQNNRKTVVECCKALNISRSTWYNRVKEKNLTTTG